METKIIKPTLHYNEFISHNGMDLEILGESFDEPIKTKDADKFYSKVTVINCEFGEPCRRDDGAPHIAYFLAKNNSEEELKKIVQWVKNDTENLPK